MELVYRVIAPTGSTIEPFATPHDDNTIVYQGSNSRDAQAIALAVDDRLGYGVELIRYVREGLGPLRWRSSEWVQEPVQL